MYVKIREAVGKDAVIQDNFLFNHLLAAVMKLLNTQCEQPTLWMLKDSNEDDGMHSPRSLQQACFFNVLTKANHAPTHDAHQERADHPDGIFRPG